MRRGRVAAEGGAADSLDFRCPAKPAIYSVLPFAHAGHVLVDLLTMVPVVVLAGWFLVMAVRDRRRDE
jgi:hypothetical protein